MTPTPDILGSPLFALLSRHPITGKAIVVEPNPGDGDGEPVESVPGEQPSNVIDFVEMAKKQLGVKESK